jgi:Holliday junction resolvase
MASKATSQKTTSTKKTKSSGRNATNYRRGARFEYSVRDKLYEKYGAVYVVRSAGSHGVADLVAFFSWGEVWFVQCKTDGNLPNREKEKLFETASAARAQPRLAYKEGSTIKFSNLDEEMKVWKIETGGGRAG